ncbi:HupE/UreJ family protein [Marinobacterium arenosum]|uniref:HupE/UreJ family protein n=1 Tax=Marinobacterium arenosum TaxID=2862496 RepID=UPI001C989ADB|nr:HupE/UreJ family protein [Marinobacterium arenosum]MBY4678243.1 HupE/UreJ family protein [Marinobacterium arenosum]
MKQTRIQPLLATGLLLASTPALAHQAQDLSGGLWAGLSHPYNGLDHLLAMLAVGGWAALQSGHQRLTIPLTFMLMLAVGFVAALMGIHLPLLESGIASSVLVLGLLILTAARLPAIISLSLIALFALLHGFAHGSELGSAVALYFAGGFIVASLSLHLVGGGVMNRLQTRMPILARTGGAALVLTGANLVTSL